MENLKSILESISETEENINKLSHKVAGQAVYNWKGLPEGAIQLQEIERALEACPSGHGKELARELARGIYSRYLEEEEGKLVLLRENLLERVLKLFREFWRLPEEGDTPIEEMIDLDE